MHSAAAANPGSVQPLPVRTQQGTSPVAVCLKETLRTSLALPRAPAAINQSFIKRSVKPKRTVRALAASALQVESTASLENAETHVAYELLQGPLVKFSHDSKSKTPPTAVLVHGILGNKRNMQSFAQMLIQGFPSWQVLLVDLRCHGDSASLSSLLPGEHSVNSAAFDVIALLRRLRLFPHVLIGHSFGGKVVMSMTQQFGKVLPRPVQVWVLDALPGDVRAGGLSGADKPSEIIASLQQVQMPLFSRSALIDYLTERGFSLSVARWLTTNLKPAAAQRNNDGLSPLEWIFDLNGIAALYRSYENTCLWPLLEAPPQGLRLDFVKAELSSFKWAADDEARISSLGHRVHLLRDSGHWVHADNPKGLYQILAPSFERALQRISLHS